MGRPEKIEFVKQLAGRLTEAQSVVLADFKGLTVEEITGLRARLREKQVEFKVIKNRLGRLALAEADCEALDDALKGNTAWAMGIADPVEPAKILAEFAKENEKLVIKGGLLERKSIDIAMVMQLASTPNREQLLSMLAGGLKQPAVKLASAAQAGVCKIARAFSALGEKLEKEGASGAA